MEPKMGAILRNWELLIWPAVWESTFRKGRICLPAIPLSRELCGSPAQNLICHLTKYRELLHNLNTNIDGDDAEAARLKLRAISRGIHARTPLSPRWLTSFGLDENVKPDSTQRSVCIHSPPPVLTNSLDSSPSILASLSSRFQVPAEVPSNPHIERFHNAQDKNRIAKAIYVLSTPSSLFS